MANNVTTVLGRSLRFGARQHCRGLNVQILCFIKLFLANERISKGALFFFFLFLILLHLRKRFKKKNEKMGKICADQKNLINDFSKRNPPLTQRRKTKRLPLQT
jgi:hypothetical protein